MRRAAIVATFVVLGAILNLFDLSYVDVVLSLGLQLFGEVTRRRIGIDPQVLDHVLRFTKEITHEVEMGTIAQGELGVESTPTFFVGGVMLRGVQDYEVFAEAVAAATPASADPEEEAEAPEAVEDESAEADDPAAEDAASEETVTE